MNINFKNPKQKITRLGDLNPSDLFRLAHHRTDVLYMVTDEKDKSSVTVISISGTNLCGQLERYSSSTDVVRCHQSGTMEIVQEVTDAL